jgi:hypothetical protein
VIQSHCIFQVVICFGRYFGWILEDEGEVGFDAHKLSYPRYQCAENTVVHHYTEVPGV